MKKVMVILVLLVLISSTLVSASDYCSGFFGAVKCFFAGDPAKRPVVGMG